MELREGRKVKHLEGVEIRGGRREGVEVREGKKVKHLKVWKLKKGEK